MRANLATASCASNKSHQSARSRLATVLIACLALSACKSEGERAEERYRIVEKNGTRAEKCSAATEVKRAYLEDANAMKYQEWDAKSYLDCQKAKFGF